jgi:protein TonB
MFPSSHFTRFLGASVGLHILFLAGIVYLAGRMSPPIEITPVSIVDLPKEVLQKLPPLARPVPPPPSPQERIVPAPRPLPAPRTGPVPAPKRFGDAPDVAVPRTAPGQPGQGKSDGTGMGTGDRSRLGSTDRGNGPLPFLSQADIDDLARKGMPAKTKGDDSVTLDTDEFKFISYNRWLKAQVEGVLKYPELAALSKIQGTLYIEFDILKDGSLGNLELLKSSGYKILDDEALRAIRRAAPFQPLPDDWHMDHYSIRAAVLFYLSEVYIR